MRERLTETKRSTEIEYEENQLKGINKTTSIANSFRVYKDGKAGIHFQRGNIDEKDGFARAEKNLERNREYPFALETGSRTLDKTEKKLGDNELKQNAEECMVYLRAKYPEYIFRVSFRQNELDGCRMNDAGMNYRYIDCATSISISFKHKDSTDIMDGGFSFSLRDYDKKVFMKMADDYLENFNRMVDFPQEIIIDDQYYGLLGTFWNLLSAENLTLGTSLLSGRVGEKIFSEDFNLTHDLTDEECWFTTFWDGDGCVLEDGKLTLIEKGVLKIGYADKRIAAKYGVPHTKTASGSFTDLPSAGGLNLRIERSKKTVKELLNGRYAVIPVLRYGGGFNEKGDYTMPVHSSLLFNGEKILGKLPPFTMISNIYDMFGKDFIGVGSDKPIYNDKQILFRVQRGEL